MSDSLVRWRNGAVAVKTETTKGTDVIAGSPVAADFVGADCEVGLPQDLTPLQEYTGSLDMSAGIPGGLRPTIRLRIPIRGSGTAGTAPEWGKLLTACTMVETVTASAVGVPTAAASGTSSTITAASPFGTTAQQYTGMPLLLGGTVPDSLSQTAITNYTTGRVATVLHTAGSAFSTSTTLQVPINVLYGPTSDETAYKTVTIYFYADGLLWTFVGCVGDWGVELSTGQIGYLTFVMQGQFASHSATALPAAARASSRANPPRFVGGSNTGPSGISRLNGSLARISRLSLGANIGVVLPDNPEAIEGYDFGVPITRAFGGTIDPLMDTSLNVALFNAFKAGTTMRAGFMWGTTAGNRFAIVLPIVRQTQHSPTGRNGLGANSISFQADNPDGGAYICQF